MMKMHSMQLLLSHIGLFNAIIYCLLLHMCYTSLRRLLLLMLVVTAALLFLMVMVMLMINLNLEIKKDQIYWETA